MDIGLSIGELRNGLIYYIIFIASLCIREYAHAWMVNRLGDPNPAAQGRVSMNPAVHMDLIGSVIFPLICIFVFKGNFVFGWGKTLIPNSSFFESRRKGEVLAALAGPAANFFLIIALSVIGGLAHRYAPNTEELYERFLIINVLLIFLNIIPVPPRDGGVLLKHAVRMSEETYIKISQWSFLFWIAVILIPQLSALLTIAVYKMGDSIAQIYNICAR